MPRARDPLPAAVARMVDRVSDGLYALDREWRYTYVNTRGAAMVGFASEQMVGRSVWELFPEAIGLAFFTEAHAAMVEQRPRRFEAFYPPLGVWFESDLYPGPDGLTIVSRDVTEQRRARDLIATQARMLDAVGQAVIATDLDGRVTYWNRAAEALYGWTAAEATGRPIVDLTPTEQTRARAAAILAELQSGRSWAGELLLQRRDGSTFLAGVANAPVLDDDGNLIGIIGVSSDLSERIAAEAALRAGEARYRALVEAAPAFVWHSDAVGTTTYISEAFYDYTGLALPGPGELPPDTGVVIHPEDQAESAARWTRSLATGTPFEMEMRLRGADGAYRCYLARCVPVRADDGHVAGWVGISTDIDQRRRTEDELRQRDEVLRVAQAAARLGVWSYDALTNSAVWSDEMYRLIGLEPGAVAPSRDAWRARLHPEDRDAAIVAFERALAGADDFTNEFRIVRPDGAVAWLMSRARVFRDEAGRPLRVVGVNVDVTDRRAAEVERERLLVSERAARRAAEQANRRTEEAYALLDTLFAQAPVGLGFFDQDLRYVRLNRALAETNGLPPEAHLGKTPAELLPGIEGIERIMDDWRRVLATGEPMLRYEVQGETPAAPGVVRAWQENFFPVRIGDQVIGLGVVVEDVTTPRRAATERERLLAAEQAARREAEAAVELRDQALTTITHDLRNPLATIKGYAQLGRRRLGEATDDAGAAIRRMLSRIEDAADKMTAMAEDLLDTARLQAGEPLALDEQPVDLDAIVRASVAALSPTARARVQMQPSARALVGVWDRVRLERVVDNLLSNALRYSDADRPVHVRTWREAGADRVWALIEVQDEGIGIPAADLPFVFERFRRGANVGAVHGTGIGLAGVKQIVEQHGGAVAVDSVEGAGATFTVRLPLE